MHLFVGAAGRPQTTESSRPGLRPNLHDHAVVKHVVDLIARECDLLPGGVIRISRLAHEVGAVAVPVVEGEVVAKLMSSAARADRGALEPGHGSLLALPVLFPGAGAWVGRAAVQAPDRPAGREIEVDTGVVDRPALEELVDL